MSRLLAGFGRVAFWITWPASWLVLRWSHRTRLLLVCGDEFLVLRGWLGNGEWGLPGGGLHRREEPVAGLLREVKEETGISLRPDQVKFAFDGLYKNQGLRFTYHSYTAEIDSKPNLKRQAKEIAEIAWQSIDVPRLTLNYDAQQTLSWWLKNR